MKVYSLKIGIIGMFVVAITVFLAIPFACVRLDGLLRFPAIATPLDTIVGVVLLVVGGAVALWCVILFLAVGKGTPVPLSPPKRFIVRGPYKYTRNPMALGGWFMLIGETLILHSFTLLLFVAFVIIPALTLFIIKYEEPDLEKRFGCEYLEYKKKVPRWIPRL